MFNTMELLRKQKNAGFEDEQARKKAKWDDEDRAIKADERKRAEELRTQLQADAAPVGSEVEQAGPLEPDAAPMPALPQVMGKTFASRELAEKAAAEHNAPQAVMQRQSMTALRAGNPEGAARVMETGMKLGEAERKLAHEAFQRRVDGTFAWGDLATVLNESGDPNVKGRFRPSEDGKTMVMERANPDNSFEKLTEFPNTPEGFAKARAMARGMTAEQLLQHEDRVQARNDSREDRKEDRLWRREDRESERKFRASMLSQKAGAGAGGEVDPEAKLKDRRDALADFEKLLPPLSDDAAPAERAARTQVLDEADAVFELNAQNGLVLTAPQIRAAMAADQAKTQTIRDTKTGRMFRVASVNGRRVIVGVVSGQKPQEQPPAPAAEAPRPAQVTDRGLPAYASRGAAQPGTVEYEVSMAALREKQRAGNVPNPDAPRRPIGFGTVN